MTWPRHFVSAAFACALALASAAPVAAAPANPCIDPVQRAALRCPDLRMSKPFDLTLDRQAVRGRVVLRAGNSIDSVGAGPAELFGVRTSRYGMKARQRIYKRGGGRIGISTGASLYFKYVPGQGRYWKWAHAAVFELWRRDATGARTKRVRIGRKAIYCLRDLKHTRPGLARSPRRVHYPACNESGRTRKVTLGTSVGWSDVYPASYPEQWIDVTGLRGCFDYVHIADPGNGIFESNEDNNKAYVTVRLPFRRGRQNCPGPRGSTPAPSIPAPSPAPDPYSY
jgi:hypothetical protein